MAQAELYQWDEARMEVFRWELKALLERMDQTTLGCYLFAASSALKALRHITWSAYIRLRWDPSTGLPTPATAVEDEEAWLRSSLLKCLPRFLLDHPRPSPEASIDYAPLLGEVEGALGRLEAEAETAALARSPALRFAARAQAALLAVETCLQQTDGNLVRSVIPAGSIARPEQVEELIVLHHLLPTVLDHQRQEGRIVRRSLTSPAINKASHPATEQPVTIIRPSALAHQLRGPATRHLAPAGQQITLNTDARPVQIHAELGIRPDGSCAEHSQAALTKMRPDCPEFRSALKAALPSTCPSYQAWCILRCRTSTRLRLDQSEAWPGQFEVPVAGVLGGLLWGQRERAGEAAAALARLEDRFLLRVHGYARIQGCASLQALHSCACEFPTRTAEAASSGIAQASQTAGDEQCSGEEGTSEQDHPEQEQGLRMDYLPRYVAASLGGSVSSKTPSQRKLKGKRAKRHIRAKAKSGNSADEKGNAKPTNIAPPSSTPRPDAGESAPNPRLLPSSHVQNQSSDVPTEPPPATLPAISMSDEEPDVEPEMAQTVITPQPQAQPEPPAEEQDSDSDSSSFASAHEELPVANLSLEGPPTNQQAEGDELWEEWGSEGEEDRWTLAGPGGKAKPSKLRGRPSRTFEEQSVSTQLRPDPPQADPAIQGQISQTALEQGASTQPPRSLWAHYAADVGDTGSTEAIPSALVSHLGRLAARLQRERLAWQAAQM